MEYEYAFEMGTSSIRFGPGVTREIGMDLSQLKARRVMVVTDPNLAGLGACGRGTGIAAKGKGPLFPVRQGFGGADRYVHARSNLLRAARGFRCVCSRRRRVVNGYGQGSQSLLHVPCRFP